MIRKYYNHNLQTNPWHREEEPPNKEDKQSKATNSLFPINMIACKTKKIQLLSF